MSSTRPNFCSHCGADLLETANYCPQCGTQCRETTPAERPETKSAPTAATSSTSATNTGESDDTDRAARTSFRRRVEAHLVDGWKMESDRGDSVLIRNPEYGSIGVHLLLLFFTGGVGNLAYGWYCYTQRGERRILRVGGDDTVGIPEDVGSSDTVGVSADLMGYVGGAFSLLMAAVMLSSLQLPLVILGAFFFLAALWMIPATRRRWRDRHPPTTFGHTRSIDETTRFDTDNPCVVCSGSVEEGIERAYREEYVLAGIPLFTTASGANHYCRSCASGDSSGLAVDDSDDVTTETAVETEY
ncbi:zinc ribbon domain-containing protein [Halomarina oriensis]|uniref:Zinc-ribbon domain-containing protein n=1 Tax=Halomarina oriensis TaxID=671145 RepID=A0A6B0GRW8_9EURY|nr:zinc ribbon domain-containing protein [Halomarina oriensis]MWG36891.1 zinc-ribbon domain-containing protein [Halomarina oriensis]